MLVYLLSKLKDCYKPKRGEKHVSVILFGCLPALIKFTWRWRERSEILGEKGENVRRFLPVWDSPGKVVQFFNYHQLSDHVFLILFSVF